MCIRNSKNKELFMSEDIKILTMQKTDYAEVYDLWMSCKNMGFLSLATTRQEMPSGKRRALSCARISTTATRHWWNWCGWIRKKTERK